MTQRPNKQQRVSTKARRRPQRKQSSVEVKPLGPGIDWSDEMIDQMAAVTEKGLIEADVLTWRPNAPKGLKNLLEAKVEESK